MVLLQSLNLPPIPNNPSNVNSAGLGKRNEPPPDNEKEDTKKMKPSSNIWRERQKAMAKSKRN